VAICLRNYALLLRTIGRPEEATHLESRAEAIRTKRNAITLLHSVTKELNNVHALAQALCWAAVLAQGERNPTSTCVRATH
jgi:hypothetical protein